MKERYMLSNDQLRVIQEQNPDVPNISTQKKRIAENIDKCFQTLLIVLKSKHLNQDFKNNLFDPNLVSLFISSLTRYDSENTNAQESMKQHIIIDLMQQVMSYYQSRYTETKFIGRRLNEFYELAQDLEELARDEQREDEATIMYKSRGKMPTPPLLTPINDNWVAQCIWCHAYTTKKTESEAIKNVRHTKNCSYHKEWKRFGKKDKERVIQQFFKTIPPLKKSKKN